MIVLAAAAVSDAHRLYEFLKNEKPDAARRAMAAIWGKLEPP
jgi:plasmid stabilization system protein ParE